MANETRPLYSQVVTGRRPVPINTKESHQAATQPPTFMEEPANDAHKGVAHIEEGWTKVTRHQARGLKTERKLQPKLNKQMELLKAQGRCFRCLDRGHKKHHCRNNVKCIKYHGLGHTSRVCTTQGRRPINRGNNSFIPPTIPKAQPTPPLVFQRQPSPYTYHNTQLKHDLTIQPPAVNIDFKGWETMPMLSPTILPARGRELTVFFQPNDHIRSSNALLDRSAVVLLGPGPDRVNQLPRRIATAIATTFGCHPDAFKVSTVEPEAGDLLVEFPSNVLRNMAINVGVFMVARGIEIQLRAWTPNMHMVHDPTMHKVRIRLHHFPMQYGNLTDVNHLISGFGYAICMNPVITNGNFETIRVLVTCYDPITIPPIVSLHKDPYAEVVHIDLEGWLHNSSPSLQPLSDDDEGQSSSTLGPQRQCHRNRQPHRSAVGPYGRQNAAQARNKGPTGESGYSVFEENGEVRIKPGGEPDTKTLLPIVTAAKQDKNSTPKVKWMASG